MSAQGVAIAVLLVLGVGVEALCAAGLVLLPTVYDRVHLLGPAAMVGTALVAVAVVTQQGLSPLGIKAMLVTAVFWVSSPVLGHATARAARIHRHGTWLAGGRRPPLDR